MSEEEVATNKITVQVDQSTAAHRDTQTHRDTHRHTQRNTDTHTDITCSFVNYSHKLIHCKLRKERKYTIMHMFGNLLNFLCLCHVLWLTNTGHAGFCHVSKKLKSIQFWIEVIIRLEARLQPNIGKTSWPVLTMFTCLVITLPKVNRFGWNLEYSEYLVWGWPRQILSAMCAVARAGDPGEILFLCQVSNPRFHRFPIGQISRNLNIRCQSVRRWILSEQNSGNYPVTGRLKKLKNFKIFSMSCDLLPHNSAWLEIDTNSLSK